MTQKLPPKLNAATHWMTSRQPLIPGESEEALKAHLEHWNNLYPDVETDELLSDLVREAAFSHWLLLRNQRQYDVTLAILHKTGMDAWTPEQNKTYQLRERYLNSAQRRRVQRPRLRRAHHHPYHHPQPAHRRRREKEFGGHLREWPDLRAQDEPIIQMEEEKEKNVS